ncbi:MAG: aminoglycoside phosphotransferase family protein, partial [Bacteroidales bacterium]|nr:aminoglycoside phosphotransferase family protein [Bacteroidales bacterium]
ALERSLILPPGEPKPDGMALPASGSARRYFRFQRTDGSTFLGVYHADAHENAAYLDFSRQFLAKSLPVPAILYVDDTYPVYFVADAGQEALYDFLQLLGRRAEAVSCVAGKACAGVSTDGTSADNRSSTATLAENDAIRYRLYQRVIDRLIDFQYTGGRDFDYRAAYPYEAFDENAIYADLNYFKYYFLKLSGTPFDERALEADFRKLTAWLAAVPRDVLMCRDFQSRNILLGKPLPNASVPADALQAFAETVPLTFIDFQGGRRGPAAYDLATLLYEAKANLSPALREDLLRYYMTCTAVTHPYAAGRDFEADYYGFVFLRIFQAMGAYGLRGLYERKAVFLQSIPHAIANLARLADQGRLPADLPEITRIIERLRHSRWAQAAELSAAPCGHTVPSQT